jgi:hypothetical protein
MEQRTLKPHLPRPFLAIRTPSSVNHSGPMKSRSRSRYEDSPKGFGGLRSDDRRPGLGGHPDRAIPSGTVVVYCDALIQGWDQPGLAVRMRDRRPRPVGWRSESGGVSVTPTTAARVAPEWTLLTLRALHSYPQISELSRGLYWRDSGTLLTRLVVIKGTLLTKLIALKTNNLRVACVSRVPLASTPLCSLNKPHG